MKVKDSDNIYLLLLFLIALAVMLKQLVYPGYYCILLNDSTTYTRWARQFAEALGEGILYPRWMPEEFWNYGSPTFILYSPLSFYLTAFFNVFTGSILQAMNYVKLTTLILQGWGMYFLVKELYRPGTAFFTAAFYLLFPFNILQIYALGPFAGNASFMWFAPTFLCVHRYFTKGDYRYLIYAGFCYGGLVLTHLLTAYMFTFVLALFIVLMAVSMKKPQAIVALPATVTIGALLSAAYLLPLIFERKYLQLNAFVSERSGYVYSHYFFFPNLTAKMPQELFWPTYYTLLLNHALSIVAIVIVISLLLLRQRRRNQHSYLVRVNWIFIIICAVTLFFMIGWSQWLWELIPFFKYLQFPARWLSQAIFIGALITAYGLNAYGAASNRSRISSSVVALLLLALSVIDMGYIQKVVPLSEAKLSSVKPVWPEEHLPAGVKLADLERGRGREAVMVEGEGRTEIVSWGSAERELKLVAGSPARVKIATLNFPGWTAYVDGSPAGIASAVGSKEIEVNVPAGTHRLKLIFRDTQIRYYSQLVSLCSLVIFTLAALANKQGRRSQISYQQSGAVVNTERPS